MDPLKDDDGNAFSVNNDKDELISSDEGPVLGKGGHVLDTRGSIDVQRDPSKGEASPLHNSLKGSASGKDLQTSHGLRVIIGIAIGFSVIVTIALILTIYLGHGQVGASGAVASDSTDCSNMGLTILEQGGNAVDAAVAAMFCEGVVSPGSSGIGGGGFMMVHDHKTHVAKVFDFLETAPRTATQNMFGGSRKNAEKGGASVAVPGEVKGMERAHKAYGRLSWNAVVQPAANLARNGFKVTKSLATTLRKFDPRDFTVAPFNIYLNSDNKFVKEGDTVKNVLLADTLDVIADKGSKAFYDGELTQGILDAVNEGSSVPIMAEEDLKGYKVIVRDVVKTTYHDHTIISASAPASGPALLSVMNILELYNLKPADQNTTHAIHKIIEAFKFGFAQQQHLADPKFVSTVENSTAKMISKSIAKIMANKTTDKAHSDPAYYDGVVATSTERGTTHISVIDAQELMVSVTTSVNDIFGSKVITESGIILNNQMADFADPKNPDTKNNKLNYIVPGKRPLSSMSPLILYNEDSPCKMRLVLGGENGTKALTGVAQVLVDLVSYGMTMADALPAPRFHTQLYPGQVQYEDGIPEKVITELKQLGHDMVKATEPIGFVQGVKKVNNAIHAKSDPRKGGIAAMFNSNV